jgi:hypothetical protein
MFASDHSIDQHNLSAIKMTIPQTQTVAWLEKPHPEAQLEIRHDLAVPEPAANEVLIKVEYTGFWSVIFWPF